MSDNFNDDSNDEENEFYHIDDEETDSNEEVDEEKEILDIVDNSFITFSHHKEPVFTCDLTKDEKIAATGSQEDKAIVWYTETCEIIFECFGHKDSVISVKFNCNDQYLATGDMSGIIKIWDVKNKNCIKKFYLHEITWIEWHPYSKNIFLCGTIRGESNLTIFTESNHKQKAMFCDSSACCGTFLKDGKKSVVGYENGNIKIWDLKEESVIFNIKNKFDNNSLTTLCVKSDNSLIAAGYLNSQTKLIKIATGKCIFTIENENFTNEENSVETIAFCDELQLLIIGYIDGTLQIWDINTFIKRDTIKLTSGITKIVFNKTNAFLFYIASLDGVIRLYDIRDSKLLNKFTGHSKEILDLVVGENYILSCSEDTTCKLFKLNY